MNSNLFQFDLNSFNERSVSSLWFIHIPKCGGNYIKSVFRNTCVENLGYYLCLIQNKARYLRGQDNLIPLLCGGHSHGIATRDKRIVLNPPFDGDGRKGFHSSYLESELFYSSFVFSTIRNPFDMLVSLYFFNLGSNIKNNVKVQVETFDKFIELLCDNNHNDQLYEDLNLTLCRSECFKRFLFFQLFNISGICQANAIFRLETIKDSITKMFIGDAFAKDLSCLNEIIQPRLGTIRNDRDYRKYYTQKSVDLVYKKFGREIKFFGYDFEDGLTSTVDIIDTSNFMCDLSRNVMFFSNKKIDNLSILNENAVESLRNKDNKDKDNFDRMTISDYRGLNIPTFNFMRAMREQENKIVDLSFNDVSIYSWLQGDDNAKLFYSVDECVIQF